MPPRPFTRHQSRRRAASTSARRRRNERSLSRADGLMADVRRVVLIACLALLIAAPAAQAGTVGVSGSTLTVRGGGVANDLAVDRGGGLVRVHDGAGGLNGGTARVPGTGFCVIC